MVSAYISPVGATVETLRIQLVYISGIMLLLAVGLAFLITRRVARPIARLSDAARRMGAGDAGVTFRTAGKSYREIAELADTLDYAREELARTDRLRQELIANVSHDLRTPLTLITGYGEMIRDLPDENTPENMQVIIDESKRLTSLVTDLLDLSRLQSGTGKLEFSRFNLTEATKAIIARFAKLCEQEGFVILFERDEDVFITADPARIAQVTYNFLINAVTHTGEDKRIVVRQIVGHGRVTIRVEDNGAGIPADMLPNIWNRYYKADEPHKRPKTGSGLGLSIVKSILDQHPGVEYGVESTVGVGSAFWFSVPV
jgi:signal transduction histidine kinase